MERKEAMEQIREELKLSPSVSAVVLSRGVVEAALRDMERVERLETALRDIAAWTNTAGTTVIDVCPRGILGIVERALATTPESGCISGGERIHTEEL